MMRIKKIRKLNDAIPDWMTGYGVMSVLTDNYDVPWKSAYPVAIDLDIAYHGGRSGGKLIAPLPSHFLDDATGTIPPSDVLKIMGAVNASYNRKWARLWDLYMSDYKPLENYNMHETVKEGVTNAKTGMSTTNTTNTETHNTQDVALRTGTVNEDVKDRGERDLVGVHNNSKNITGETSYGKTDTQTHTGSKTDNETHGDETTTTVNGTVTENIDETRTLDKTLTPNVTEKHTGTQATANTGTQVTAGNDTNTETRDLGKTSATNGSTTNNDNIFGFNSSVASPSNSADGTSTANTTETEKGTIGNVGTKDVTRTDNLTATRTDDLTVARTGSETTNETVVTDGIKATVENKTETVENDGIKNTTTTMNLTDTSTLSGKDNTETTETDTGDTHDAETTKLDSEKTTTNNLNDTVSRTGTIGNTGTASGNTSENVTTDRDMETHRYGNIGVMSAQRLFMEEVEVWKWNFFDEVFEDIDGILVLAVSF